MSSALRDQRLQAGLTQQELATRAKCSISMLRLLEKDYVPGHSEVLDRIARVLDSDRATLCGPLVNASRPAPASRANRAEILKRWNHGFSAVDIANALDLRADTVRHAIMVMRRQGFELYEERDPRRCGAVTDSARDHERE